MTLLEHAIKLLTWRWRDFFALRDDAGHLIAAAEKSALNTFALHRDADVFSIRPRSRGCLEVCQPDGAVIGEVKYQGMIASELVSSLPSAWEASMKAFVMWLLVFYIQHERRADNN
jgi:hypothetical protein